MNKDFRSISYDEAKKLCFGRVAWETWKDSSINVVGSGYIYNKKDFDKVRPYNCENMIGNKYGEWTVLAYDILRSCRRKQDGSTVGTYYLCKCSCGKLSSVLSSVLRRGRSTRCSSCSVKFDGRGYTYLYIISAPTVNKFKIGVTRNMKTRFEGLCSLSPVSLNLLFYKKYTDRKHALQVENIIHTMLNRYRSHGEWFEFSQKYLASIISIIENSVLNHPKSAQESFQSES